jgi:hypothetical protein
VAGVLQGSSISPIGFSLFIDDMIDNLEFSKFHVYADEISSGSDFRVLIF